VDLERELENSVTRRERGCPFELVGVEFVGASREDEALKL